MVTYYFGFPPLGESNLVKGIASLPLWLSLLPQGRGTRAHGASFPGCRLLSPVPGPVLGAAEMWMGLTPCPCCWRPETRLGPGAHFLNEGTGGERPRACPRHMLYQAGSC